MARAYSSDLRDRVVAAVMAGATVRAAVDRSGVSVASAVKWSQRYRATGSAAAKPRGGKKPYVLVAQREWLLARIAEAPDLTLRAVMAELVDRGVAASYHAVYHVQTTHRQFLEWTEDYTVSAAYGPGAEPPLKREFYEDYRKFDAGRVLRQDFANIADVQRGLKSRAFPGSRLYPVQEQPVANFHRTIRAFLTRN